jgi:hypothetical protein
MLSTIAAVAYLRQTRGLSVSNEIAAPVERQYIRTDESNLQLIDLAAAQYGVLGLEKHSQLPDAVAVASLVMVLDHSKDMSDPGWDELCESIVREIARTGDTRCLPALDRVRLARGSEFRDAVDAAVVSITQNQRREFRMECAAHKPKLHSIVNR